MTRIGVFLLVALLAAAPGVALAAPAVWTVDKAASKLGFASSFGGQAFTGVFRRWDAQIRFDPKDLAHSTASVSVDMASAFTANPDRDVSLPTEDWFWVTHFPRATFVAQGFRAIGPGRYEAAGLVTLRGVSKPLTLPFTLAITGPTARMSATVALNRLAFGVGQDDWAKTDSVPAAVSVSVDLTARRAP